MIKSQAGLYALAILATVILFSAFTATGEEVYSGTVASVDTNSFTVESENEDGEPITKDFVITDATKFYVDDEEGSVEDLEVYDEVEVTYEIKDDKNIATKVVISVYEY